MSQPFAFPITSAVALVWLVTVATVPAQAGALLLLEAHSKRVLAAENVDQPWFPASLTKLMTAYLVFEDLKAGSIARTDKLTVSAHANRRPRSRLGLGAGKELTYEEALAALILASANDIAVALAEARAGSEAAFVERMNATAVRLGMTSSRFINAHGLPGEGQQSTARDLARLTLAILSDFPDEGGLFALKTAQVAGRTIGSHNPVLAQTIGGNGMKTGFTCSAGYNIVGSASRGEHKIIAIVLGEGSSGLRARRTAKLIETGFGELNKPAAEPGMSLDELPNEVFDATIARTRNLDLRFRECLAPIPMLDANGATVCVKATPQEALASVEKAQGTAKLDPEACQKATALRKQAKVTKRLAGRLAKRQSASLARKPAKPAPRRKAKIADENTD